MADTVDRIAVLRLSKLELGVLLALLKLGMDVYRDGITGPLADTLDAIPQAVFASLADKIKSAA